MAAKSGGWVVTQQAFAAAARHLGCWLWPVDRSLATAVLGHFSPAHLVPQEVGEPDAGTLTVKGEAAFQMPQAPGDHARLKKPHLRAQRSDVPPKSYLEMLIFGRGEYMQ